MTVQTIDGVGGMLIPPISGYNASVSTQAVINATGQKIAMCGRFAHPNRSNTSPIRKIRFLPVSVTSAGGSVLTLSLQDISLVAAPLQPDETQDQTVAAALSGMTSGTWFTSGALSTDRTVAVGDLLAVVFEYDGAGRLGADTFTASCMVPQGLLGYTQATLKTGGVWTQLSNLPTSNVILECADGTLGTLDGAFVFNLLSSVAFNSGSSTAGTGDEVSMIFQLPGPVKTDGCMIYVGAGTAADFNVVLYDSDGTTALSTTVMDGMALSSTGTRLLWVQFASLISLAANTNYRLAILPTTVNNVTVMWFTVGNAAELDCMPGGTNFQWSWRTNAGSWTEVTTKRPLFAIRVSAIADDARMLYVGGNMDGV